MMKSDVPLFWNEDKTAYGVLVSRGYGSGWSTWGDKRLAYDKRIIEFFLEKSNGIKNFLQSIGYGDVFCNGWNTCELVWIPEGRLWRINEYDGAETIEFFSPDSWNCFYYKDEDE